MHRFRYSFQLKPGVMLRGHQKLRSSSLQAESAENCRGNCERLRAGPSRWGGPEVRGKAAHVSCSSSAACNPPLPLHSKDALQVIMIQMQSQVEGSGSPSEMQHEARG
jgi:hypothetical protein